MVSLLPKVAQSQRGEITEIAHIHHRCFFYRFQLCECHQKTVPPPTPPSRCNFIHFVTPMMLINLLINQIKLSAHSLYILEGRVMNVATVCSELWRTPSSPERNLPTAILNLYISHFPIDFIPD